MNIPNHAKKVFDGVIFDVYQWDQEMFDGTIETFEALRRSATLEVIATQDNKIILTEEEQPAKPPFTAFLGGRLEEGENPLEGAKRELLEESGMVSDDWQLYKTYRVPGKIDWPTYMYIARNCRKVAEPQLDAGEKIDLRPVDFEEFLDLAKNDKLYLNQRFTIDLLKYMLEPEKLTEFKTLLFKE